MKKLIAFGAASLALVLAPPAGAEGEDHNCAGAFVSSLAGPGFGGAVSSAAHLQLVDNFGLANCGLPPRNNP